ncbi:hypothetical protein AB0M19_24245 [Streptomyces sp. NPDC051920]|uniref:hypothetical protein n=1 Tax=Streptomyces sp. NPDC051920 TaxID=3155523 RepID=UPI003449F5E8
MRAIRVASAALLGVTALTFAAPAALAGDGDHGLTPITPFAFSVQPSTVAAGGQVSLLLKRDGQCRGTATVTSGIFDTVSIPPGQSSATTTVDWDARPGAVYDVTFSCGGASGSTGLTISGSRPLTPTPVPLQRGVRAGVGGSAGGFDLKQIGMGAALIAGSVGAAWYLSRRRTSSDET